MTSLFKHNKERIILGGNETPSSKIRLGIAYIRRKIPCPPVLLLKPLQLCSASFYHFPYQLLPDRPYLRFASQS